MFQYICVYIYIYILCICMYVYVCVGRYACTCEDKSGIHAGVATLICMNVSRYAGM